MTDAVAMLKTAKMPRWLALRVARVSFSLLFLGAFATCGVLAACSSSDAMSAAAPKDPTATPADDAAPPPASDNEPPSGNDGTAGKVDAEASAPDAGDAGTDGAPSGDILGTLSATCGTIHTMLTSPSPTFVSDKLVFVAGESYDKASLSPGGQRMFDTANAGGSSTESETMSFEVLHFCEGATLLKTETEVLYAPPDAAGGNKITDLLVEIDGLKVGVSVTRSYKPSNIVQTDAEVKALLEKKLGDILQSSARVLPADKWVKQILHVFTANKAATDAVARVYPMVDTPIRADTIVLVTETQGGGFIYCDPNPALGSECPPAP